MSPSVDDLSFDVVFHIARFLNFRDIVNLSLCCRQLYGQLHEEVVCKHAVECHVPNSKEAEDARAGLCTYQNAFQRIYRRQAAVASAKPVTIKQVALAGSCFYRDGILSWITADYHFCTTDTRQKEQRTTSYDIKATVSATVRVGDHFDKLVLLSSLGTVAVMSLEKMLSPTRILVVDFGSEHRNPGVIVERHTHAVDTAFARQNATHVVWGIHHQTMVHTAMDRAWSLEVISLDDPPREDMGERCSLIIYPGFGTRIGWDVQFTIHENYFLGVSTRLADKLVDGEWTSFYECVYVKLSGPQSFYITQFHRRRAQEGPIHDAWTTLQLVPSETIDSLMIVETRREWVNGSSHQVRSSYVTKLIHSETFSPQVELQPDWSAWVHHDCYKQEFRPSALWFSTYNLSVRAFVDIGLEQDAFRLRISNASNKTVAPEVSKAAQITAEARQEQIIFCSKACNSFYIPLDAPQGPRAGEMDDSYGAPINDDPIEDTTFADERSLILLIGPRESLNKQLVLINFDPSL